MEFLFEYRSSILLGVCVFGLAVAFRRGGRPEQITFSTFIAMWIGVLTHDWIASGQTTMRSTSDYLTVNLGDLIVDLVALAVFVWLAIRANRIYPIWIAGFQLVSMMTHLPRELNPTIFPQAYAIFNRAPFYLILATAAIGLWRQARRSEPEAPWRSS